MAYQAFTPLWGLLGLLPGTWGTPNEGNADEAKVFLAMLDACGLATGPILKTALCQICTMVGRMMNTQVSRVYPGLII